MKNEWRTQNTYNTHSQLIARIITAAAMVIVFILQLLKEAHEIIKETVDTNKGSASLELG